MMSRAPIAAALVAGLSCAPSLAHAEEPPKGGDTFDASKRAAPKGYGTFDSYGTKLGSGTTGKGLVIAGPIVWGAAYAISGYLAFEGRGNRNHNELTLIPVVGPWIAAGTLDIDGGVAAAMVADGVVQLAGLGMLAAGLHIIEWEVEVEVQGSAYELDLGVTGPGQLTLGGSF